jgi:hypothetical protein
MDAQRTRHDGQQSPLKGERGNTIISDAVVSQVAGIAAQEVEKVQMGGGAAAAVGGFLQSVTGSVSGGSSGGGISRWPSSMVYRSHRSPTPPAAT